MAKNFETFPSARILALAVYLEEEDGRIYGDFADGLRQTYPDTARTLGSSRGFGRSRATSLRYRGTSAKRSHHRQWERCGHGKLVENNRTMNTSTLGLLGLLAAQSAAVPRLVVPAAPDVTIKNAASDRSREFQHHHGDRLPQGRSPTARRHRRLATPGQCKDGQEACTHSNGPHSM